MNNIYLILIWFTISAISFPSHAQTDLFKHFHTTVLIGGIFPQDNLRTVLDDRPVFGLKLSSPYYGNWRTNAELQYALLGGDSPRSLHYVKTGLGVAYELPTVFLPVAGLGLSNYFIRSTAGDADGDLLMDDNESEFGAYPFLCWNVPVYHKLFLQAGLEWDLVFSRPHFSQLPNVYLGLGWSWW